MRRWLRHPVFRSSYGRRLDSRAPLGYDKSDQENHNPDAADDVRHHGESTRDIARVGPDQADNRSHDEQSDHRGQPVEDPACGDNRW